MSENKIIYDLNDFGNPLIAIRPNYLPFIVSKNTGVFYTIQCGGAICEQPEEEGYLMTIHNKFKVVSDDADCSHACWLSSGDDERKKSILEARIEYANVLNEKFEYLNNLSNFSSDMGVAIKIEEHIFFNFERVNELMEGWWPIIYRRGVEVYHGILCGWNCD